MPETIPKLMTIGELATRFSVSTHRLKYAIEQYHVEPTRRVGIIRVWAEDKVPLIERALATIAEKRGVTKPGDGERVNGNSAIPAAGRDVDTTGV